MDDWLERFATGDEDAFEMLFRQYQGEVYRWIVGIVRDSAAAEDLTIETFWRIHRWRKRFDAKRAFGPWARRIATRVAIDYLRGTPLTREPLVPSPSSSEPDLLLERERRSQIAAAFSTLPSRLRLAATLALIEERPYQEIAEALDISLSATKMRVSRAVRLLRRKLERMGIQP